MARPGPNSIWLTILLGGLAALPPLAIDLALPALPQIGEQLHGSAAGAGLTLSLFMAGFASTQLALGPLSDWIGRRPVLIGGMLVFTLGGLGCAFAPTLPILLLKRLLQGAGAAAGSVMAYAIVRDLFQGRAAREKFAAVAVVSSVAPVIGPTLGALILTVTDWRGIYAVLTVAGLLLTVGVVFGLNETKPRFAGVRPGLVASYRQVLGHRRVSGFIVANALGFGCMFAYVAGSPLVFVGVMGVSTTSFALLFAATAGTALLGSALAGRLAKAGVPPDVPLRAGIAAQALSALALIPALLMTPRIELLLPLMMVGTFSRGLFVPTATHAAMEPLPELAGSTAAVLGCLQMAVGAVSSALVAGLFPLFGPVAMALVMTAFGTAAAVICLRTADRRALA